jgi:hypothetical protein
MRSLPPASDCQIYNLAKSTQSSLADNCPTMDSKHSSLHGDATTIRIHRLSISSMASSHES